MLLPGPLAAQDWATWDLCNVTSPKLDLSVFPDLDSARIERDASKITNGTGNFWEIRSDSGAVSHLWGTTHANLPIFMRLPDTVEARIRSARVVALEFDPVLRDRAELTKLWTNPEQYLPQTSSGRFPTTNIAEVLRPELLNWIDARLAATGWGAGAAPYLKEAALAEILLNWPCNDFGSGVYPIQDSLIQTLGAISGAQILGLEDASDFRNKLNDPKNRGLTFDMIRLYAFGLDPSQTHAQHRNGAALYLEGRNALSLALEREAARKFFGDNRGPAIQDRVNGYLLDERNVGFVDTALPELAQGDVFIAVGSWHLPGEAGMVEMLRKAGYTVTRIPLPREAE